MHATQSHGTRGLPTIARRVGASMHPCMNSSTWHKPRLPDINIRSVMTTQVPDLSGKAAVKMQPLISPLCHQSESCRMMALWPLDHETSDVIASDRSTISKIRARQSTRLDELYTPQAADDHESQRRERALVPRNPNTPVTTRHPPLHTRAHIHCLCTVIDCFHSPWTD